jgi:hypothetical protein
MIIAALLLLGRIRICRNCARERSVWPCVPNRVSAILQESAAALLFPHHQASLQIRMPSTLRAALKYSRRAVSV